MVFQSYALYPHMTVYQNMSFGLRLPSWTPSDIDAAVRSAARKLHIEHLLDRKPRALSGGQKQRVAIGRAIVGSQMYFCSMSLCLICDAALRVSMRHEFAKLHQELKTTMIYVTHDQIEAMTLGERIVVLSAGRIEQAGTPMELYRDPDNIFVAGFIGSPRMNFFDAEVLETGPHHTTVRLRSGDIVRADVDVRPALPGDNVTLGVRPEHFDPRRTSNVLQIKVRFVEPLGSVTVAYGALAGSETEVIGAVGRRTPVRPGETLQLGIEPRACHVFDRDGRAFRRSGERGQVARARPPHRPNGRRLANRRVRCGAR